MNWPRRVEAGFRAIPNYMSCWMDVLNCKRAAFLKLSSIYFQHPGDRSMNYWRIVRNRLAVRNPTRRHRSPYTRRNVFDLLRFIKFISLSFG